MDALDSLEKLACHTLSPVAEKKLKRAFQLIREALEEELKVYEQLRPVFEELKLKYPNNKPLKKLLETAQTGLVEQTSTVPDDVIRRAKEFLKCIDENLPFPPHIQKWYYNALNHDGYDQQGLVLRAREHAQGKECSYEDVMGNGETEEEDEDRVDDDDVSEVTEVDDEEDENKVKFGKKGKK